MSNVRFPRGITLKWRPATLNTITTGQLYVHKTFFRSPVEHSKMSCIIKKNSCHAVFLSCLPLFVTQERIILLLTPDKNEHAVLHEFGMNILTTSVMRSF